MIFSVGILLCFDMHFCCNNLLLYWEECLPVSVQPFSNSVMTKFGPVISCYNELDVPATLFRLINIPSACIVF